MHTATKSAVIAGIVLAFASVEATAATTWNVSLWGKRRAFTEHVEKLAELVSAKTNGEFKLNLGYGETLSKNRENLDGIKIGAFEMAQICAGYHENKNPTLTVLELPFLGVQDLKQEIAVSIALYEHPAVKKDLARWDAMALMPSPMPQYNVAGTGSPPKSPADFNGRRIRATGGLGEAFKTVGAVPTSVTASEAFNAMESGVVDSVAFAQHAHLAFRTVDIAKWWTVNLNPGTVQCPVVVSISAYKGLKPEFRKALDSSIEEALEHYLVKYGEVYKKWDPLLEKKGIQKIVFTNEQLREFRAKAAEPARAAWVDKMNAQGIPGQELYDLVMKKLDR